MINKNVDYALVGHNYLTFLLSEGLLNRNKKVLLLDDDRFNYGDFFTNSLTNIDLLFIKKYGELTNSTPLLEIDKFITTEPRFFYLGKKQILLGRSPAQNLKELCRKLPEFFSVPDNFNFSEEDCNRFDLEFNSFCEKVIARLLSPDKNNRLYQNFYESAGELLKTIFDQFISKIAQRNSASEESKFLLSSFLYMTRGFYQSHFSISGSKVELIHNLLCLLSPYYRLNYHSLNANLLERFTQKGGEFKKLNLADLKFQRGVIKGLELESYDGLVLPKKIIFVGGHPMGLSIRFERPRNVFNCLSVEVDCNNIPHELIGRRIIFSSVMKVSTSRPLFELHISENKLVLNIVVQKKNGIKVEFIQGQILEDLKSDLNFIFPNWDVQFGKYSMKFSHDIFIEEFSNSQKIKNEFKLKNKLTDLLFFMDPILFNRPKNVYYLGPYNDGFLGTLSSLIEIHKWQKEI